MTAPQIHREKVVSDLHQWQEESRRLLPLDPDLIAKLESLGYIVDLQTSVVFADPDAQEVTPI